MKRIFTIKTRQDAEDFVRGCAFYGTGGGGDFAMGVEEIVKQLEKGNEVGWVDPYKLDEDSYSCCPFLMGSIAPEDPEVVKEREIIYGLGAPEDDFTQAMVGAIRALEELHRRDRHCLLPKPSANTPACLCAAAEQVSLQGRRLLGRAIPGSSRPPFIFEKGLASYVRKLLATWPPSTGGELAHGRAHRR